MSEELNMSPVSDTGEPAQRGKRVLRRTFRRGVLAGACIVLAVLALLVLGGLLFFRGASGQVLDRRNIIKIKLIAEMIDKYYYKDVNAEDLADGMLHGLVTLGTGDRYSSYLNEEEFAKVKTHLAGSYAGVGITLSRDSDTGKVTVVKVVEDSPCDKAGVKKGDEIISADGVMATSTDLSTFVAGVKGEKGTTVHLVFKKKDGTRYEVDLEREDIVYPSVSYQMLDDNIGYISITEFDSNTKSEFDKALKALKEKDMQAVIYDVRSNSGGLVDSVTKILDEILPKGVTVYMLDKAGKRKEFKSDEAHKLPIPSVVLTSGSTASAAEIFAGAMRDFDYATLIGQKTYGKGIVQQTVPLTDGTALKLTMETYFTPKGEMIHEKGIKPDIELAYDYKGDTDAVDYDYLADVQIQKSIDVLRSSIQNEKR